MAHQDMDIARIKDPRLKRLLEYWTARRGERAMPARADIDPLAFPYALGHIALVEVEPGQRPRYRCRIDGTIFATVLGHDFTGKYLDAESFPAECADRIRAYGELVSLGQPIHYAGTRDLKNSSRAAEGLLLPLSSDGRSIDMILDCMFVTD
jgi:hypothetical protein